MLSLEEERGDGVQRNSAAWHAAELIIVPIPPASLRELPGWRASLRAPGEATPAPLVVTTIEFGHVPIDAGDAKVLLPNLPVTRGSIFVRLKLGEARARERLGAPLLITLTSPARPRLWLWLNGG